jgi:hypothetical protein
MFTPLFSQEVMETIRAEPVADIVCKVLSQASHNTFSLKNADIGTSCPILREWFCCSTGKFSWPRANKWINLSNRRLMAEGVCDKILSQTRILVDVTDVRCEKASVIRSYHRRAYLWMSQTFGARRRLWQGLITDAHKSVCGHRRLVTDAWRRVTDDTEGTSIIRFFYIVLPVILSCCKKIPNRKKKTLEIHEH